MKITEEQKTYAADLAERVVMTFFQAVIGVYTVALVAGQTSALSDASFAMKAAIAGAAAVASLLKGLIAKSLTSSETASALPAALDTTDSAATSPSDGVPVVLKPGQAIVTGPIPPGLVTPGTDVITVAEPEEPSAGVYPYPYAEKGDDV